MEWTTISITLAFQYNNFCFGIVLSDPGAVSHQKYVLCGHTCPGVISWKTKATVYLLFTRENWKFMLENQMVHIISFRRLQKIWVVIWDDAINLFFYPFQSVQLIWIYSVCSGLFTHHFKFNRYIFLHKISTQVVCVNGTPQESKINQSNDFISNFILLHEKFLQFDWFRAFSLIWNT